MMNNKGKVSTLLISVIFASILCIFLTSFYYDLVTEYNQTITIENSTNVNSSFTQTLQASETLKDTSDDMLGEVTKDGKISILEIGGLGIEGVKAVVLTTFSSFTLLFTILKEANLSLGLPGGVIESIIAIITLYIIFKIISAFMARGNV